MCILLICMRKSFKYRLYPTKFQLGKLEFTLYLCRNLYNCALEERIKAYKSKGVTLSYKDQANELPKVIEELPEYKEVFSQVKQDVLKRIDKSYQGFFRRVKAKGEKAGFPRFQGRNRYNSFTYPQSGFKLEDNNRLYLSKIGSVKVKMHRPIVGIIKTCTIKCEGNQWYVVFSCDIGDAQAKNIEWNNDIGIDVGITTFTVTSDDEFLESPRPMKAAKKKLRREQRSLSRKKKGSNRRKKQANKVAKLHLKVKRQRDDFQHKLSRYLVDKYDVIYYEALNIKNMVRNHKLAFHIADSAW